MYPRTLIPLSLTLSTLAALIGCTINMPASPAPVAHTNHAAQPSTTTTDAESDAGRDLTFFGEDPDSERVPFEARLVTNLTQHSFTTDGLDFDPDVLASEDLIAFASTRNATHADIYLKRADGFTLTQLTGDPADDIQPRFSPDGNRIAFASNRTGNWDIWVVHRDGTGLTQLTSDNADEVAPTWSPDGKQIAYTVSSGRSQQWEIWVLNVDQPGMRQFLAYGMFPAWAPDGSRIAYQRARQRGSGFFSVWTLDLVNGEARYPTEVAQSDNAACVAPRWSPDGRMLVYAAVRDRERSDTTDRSTPPAADLWVVDLETGLRMKLTDGAAADFNPVWANAGRVFFVSARAGTENIWSLSTTMSKYEQVEPVAAHVPARLAETASDIRQE